MIRRDHVTSRCLDQFTLLRAYVEAAKVGRYGRILFDDKRDPRCVLVRGDLNLLAGEPKSENVTELLDEIPFFGLIGVPGDDWRAALERRWGSRLKALKYDEFHCFDFKDHRTRQATFPDGFDIAAVRPEHLRSIASLCPGLCTTFGGAAGFFKNGCGYCVASGSRVLSLAATVIVCSGMAEIFVGTRENYRRRGLATACLRRLLPVCASHGLRPTWLSLSRASSYLAESLGFYGRSSSHLYYIGPRKR